MPSGTQHTIIVPSCDKYQDLWAPFFSFLFKFWPDCQSPVYLFTNKGSHPDARVSVIRTGPERNWSSELKAALEQLTDDYILLILEDYFIYEPVNNEAINRLFEVARQEHADFLRLGCFPSRYNSYYPYDPLPGYPDLAKVRTGGRYYINLQTAIWKRQSLLDLLVDGENPWEFEINGSQRASARDFISLCVMETKGKEGIHGPIMYIGGAVTKGKWMLDAIRLARKNNIRLDTGRRPVETRKEEVFRKLYIATPLSMRPAYQVIARKLGIKW